MSDFQPSRDEARTLLNQYVKTPGMLKHSYASEAVMRALAKRLGEDEHKWAVTGLLHDLDVELTNADLSVHGLKTAEILKQKNYPQDMIDAIKMHNEKAHGLKRSITFHHALASAETMTGLIVATTLVYPDKKLSGVKPKSIVKRMKERAFAASVDRDIIRECEKVGLHIDEFAELALNAMRTISDKLGL
ncbi:MAG: HDIG domain-containing protein [Deltaproteobacteria bacterium]|nr:HDIG domain-containing protein [Deltaproteobacteria bacterium]